MTAAYIRRAAETARRLPAEHAHAAFLLGLGIALDQSGQLQENAVLRELYKKIESDADRTHRLAVLGKPTILGREDLLSHFVVSAALTELLGDRLAETAGIFKESTDSTGASGFSFVDLTADLAGIAFARRLIEREGALEEWGKGFTVRDYMPDVTGLKEDLPRNDFVRDYGATTDPRFRAELEGIRKRVAALPAHAKSAAPGKTR